MKVVILAGGFGTRLSEETDKIPKPMVEIGDKPMLWHIMKIYSYFGFNEFIICGGYKQNIIKDFFMFYRTRYSDIEYDFKQKKETFLSERSIEPWKVIIVDTGIDVMTGGRIKRIEKYIKDENFLLTYGDGLSDVDIRGVVNMHLKSKMLTTITAVRNNSKYGNLELDAKSKVTLFKEKSFFNESWINGGFMIMNKKIFKYIDGDSSILESDLLEYLTKNNKLQAFKHEGFWHSMDTLKDKNSLNDMWNNNNAPWKQWNE